MKYTKQHEIRKKKLIQEVGKCEKCELKFNLTVDHIIPVQILLQMGYSKEQTYDEKNFQILCGPCNANKGVQLDFSDKRTRELLNYYMDNIYE